MQANKKEIEHPEVGRVLFRKNARSKRITLRVKNDASIVVTLPKRSSYAAAEKILNDNIYWVKTQLTNAKQVIQTNLLSYDSVFQIRNKELCIVPTEAEKGSIVYGTTQIKALIPTKWNISEPNIQEVIQAAIIQILRREGKGYLPNRVKTLAQLKGIQINDVRIKKVKTRWGSCSSKGNINLSLYLMLLSDDLIDYVICHELAHIKHQNHSPAFWNHLEKLLPGAAVLDKEMNRQKIPF